MSDARDRWAEFLNPDVMRTRFVAMGLFMVAYEMLLDAIKDRPLSYFSNEWIADGGWRPSDVYRQNVLALDPRGKGDALRGSLAWLRKMDVIDEADMASVKMLTDARNMVAHEIREIIGSGKMPDFVGLFPRLVELLSKIERWWIINVDIATDPDLAGQEIDEDGVTPASVLVIQMLSRVALGEEEEAWELYRSFLGSEDLG